jgi:hypothetical protein
MLLIGASRDIFLSLRSPFLKLKRNVSAYHDEHGSNFTSAIPTNVFGPNDNLYAIIFSATWFCDDDPCSSVTSKTHMSSLL